MDYRLADSKDTERLAELLWKHKSEDESFDYDITMRKNYIRSCSIFLKQALKEEFCCFVAVENEIIIAHIYVVTVRKVPKPGKPNGRWGYVTAVYTGPEYRNRGIGSALMNKAKSLSREQDLEFLIVWPSEQSIPFYERAGFNGKNEVLELPL